MFLCHEYVNIWTKKVCGFIVLLHSCIDMIVLRYSVWIRIFWPQCFCIHLWCVVLKPLFTEESSRTQNCSIGISIEIRLSYSCLISGCAYSPIDPSNSFQMFLLWHNLKWWSVAALSGDRQVELTICKLVKVFWGGIWVTTLCSVVWSKSFKHVR
jgi:hypothetical protein